LISSRTHAQTCCNGCEPAPAVRSDHPSLLDELGYGKPLGLVPVGGGCIADAAVATFANGAQAFVKQAPRGHEPLAADMFECEAQGLRTLAGANAIRVPKVLAVDKDALVLELIQGAQKRRDFAEHFGRRFAALHQHRGRACGFGRDNYIGTSRQFNKPLAGAWDSLEDPAGSGWPEFFLERRLHAQARLAASKGRGHQLGRLLDRAEAHIVELLGEAIEPPSLLHGDLWSGNYIVDDLGEACLIDPAVYFGHREADLAMTRLFGGFEAAFYGAYYESAPLAPGHEERQKIYQLYHVLNHFNLFGGGYFEQSKRILQRYAR